MVFAFALFFIGIGFIAGFAGAVFGMAFEEASK